MIFEKLEDQTNFTNSEKSIAEYILKNPFSLVGITASQLGQLTMTSKATVFRFCKKVGVKSFDELKQQVQYESHEKERVKNFMKKEPFDQSSTMRDVTGNLPFFYDSAIISTNAMMDNVQLNRIIKNLRDAQIIDFYGVGITHSCATAAVFKFQTTGKTCAAYSFLNEHYAVSQKHKKKVSIMLSFTGGNQEIVNCAKKLKKLGMYLIGIGGLESTELKDCCNEYIEIYQEDLVTSFEVMTPYISMTYILDILFAGLLVKDFNRHFQDSMEVRELLKRR